MNRKQVLCSRCLTIREHKARGYCAACYAWHQRRRKGPRVTRVQVTVEEYEHLLPAYGAAFDAIATRIGLKPDTLEKNLRRAGYRVVRSEGGGRRIFGAGNRQV